MHDAIKNALMLAKNRRKYQTGGVPDDNSQETFLHEQLQDSAPQYDQQGGLETAKSAAQSLAGMTTPGALADAAGYLGGPSALQNLRDQNYFDAALQLAAVVPGVGPLSKAAKIAKEGKAAAEAEEAILKGFRTAKGSVYEVTPEGYTIRNKAPRPEHPGSHGLQPPSKRTVYVPEEELQKLAEFQAQSPHQRGLMYHNETNRLGIMYGSGPEAGTIPERTIVSFSTTPAVGLTPIEDFGQSRVHFGNPITELYHSGNWPPANNPKYSIETASPDLRTNRRYTTVEQAAKSRPSGAKLVHTMIEDAPVVPPPTKRAEGGQIDDRLTASVELGQPDEASQEAFLQEQLQGSAPQYTPEEGMLTGKRAGLMAAGFAPGSGIATAAGQFPTAEGGKEPSMAEDWRKGEYLSAGLKGLGAAGDIAYGVPLVGPAVGAAMKAPLVAKLAMAAAPMAKIAGEVAPAAETVSRVTNPIGMYSAAAEAARALPQEKGTLQQMLATMKGVTPEELHWSGVSEAFAGKPTVTREELAKHFEERLPGVGEKILKDTHIEHPEQIIEKYRSKIEETYNNLEPVQEELEQKLYNMGYNDPIWNLNRGKINIHELPEEVKPLAEEWQKLNFEWKKADNELLKIEENKEDLFRQFEIENLKNPKPKYKKYQIPGGENYREVVLHLPEISPEAQKLEARRREIEALGREATEEQKTEWANIMNRLQPEQRDIEGLDQFKGFPTFRSQHWDQPNVLSHLRMSDRTGPEGEKVLHLEELQSDWGQKGRKEGFKGQPDKFEVGYIDDDGYRSYETFSNENEANNFHKNLIQNGMDSPYIKPIFENEFNIPPAPYVASPEGKHTLSWVDLGLKRALKEAAEGGYDKLIWTPGPEQAARYDLSKQIQKVIYFPEHKNFQAIPLNGKIGISEYNVEPKDLEKYVGKDIAKKLLETEPVETEMFRNRHHVLEGLDLKVGGEGMRSFYDKIVPNQLQKIVKKLDKDAKVQLGGHAIETDDGAINAHVIQITPKMREAILKGFAAYADGGAVKPKQRNSSHLGPIIERGMKITQKLSVKKGQKPTTTIPKSPKYVPQAKENAEFRKLMAEVDELLEKFKD